MKPFLLYFLAVFIGLIFGYISIQQFNKSMYPSDELLTYEGRLNEVIISQTKQGRGVATKNMTLLMEDGEQFGYGYLNATGKIIQDGFNNGLRDIRIIYMKSSGDILMDDYTIYGITLGNQVVMEEAKTRKHGIGLAVVFGFMALISFLIFIWLFRKR
jgi:hypothetical protein